MSKVTLEELLTKHFNLHGSLELVNKIDNHVECRSWTTQGHKAYARMVKFIYDLASHVEYAMGNSDLAVQISNLVDKFDSYEYSEY